jgi:hypothetical protein
MRALRYIVGGFEAFIALLALGGTGAGLIVLVQLSIHPGIGVQRLVNVRTAGFTLFESVAAAVFGWWFGRCALRNFRKASEQRRESHAMPNRQL